MDKMLSVHHKKATKLPKNKKKQVKVVYISNPMKVKTSASEFRALVQELTGQDADMPDPTRFSDADSVDGSQQEVLPHEMKAVEDHHHHVLKAPKYQYPRSEMQTRSESDLSFETSDDDIVLMPQMLENFPGLVSSNSWYGSTDAGELKSLDAM